MATVESNLMKITSQSIFKQLFLWGKNTTTKKGYLILLLNVLLGIACFERNKKTEINGKLHLEICVVCFN